MTELSRDEQKRIMIEIMDDVDSFCKENSINYYLIGGTLLGAVRHGGFIPWDDDIDIGMYRKDYEKFINSYNTSAHKGFKLININNNSHYYKVHSKVISQNTVLREHVPKAPLLGVFIDIFPLDFCPNSYPEAIAFVNKSKIYRDILSLKNVCPNRTRGILKEGIRLITQLLFKIFPRKLLISKIDTIASSLSKSGAFEYIAEITANPYGEKEIWNSKWFGVPKEVMFEGRLYWAPSDYDSVLKKTFGDYNKLPPEDKRVTHHDYDAWLSEGHLNSV